MSFDELRREILACRDCEERFGFEPHPIVFGNQAAGIMQISQAPSKSVHMTLRPFNDLSGQKLRGEWYRISDDVFYDPDNFYITSIAHCYPGKAAGGGDRPPPVYCAKKWLMREVRQVDCRLVLLVGGKATGFFFPGRDFASLVLEDQMVFGKRALVLPHPSPLNSKWLKDHPDFERWRLPIIREAVREALDLPADL